jgi:hypothetical protein
MIPCKLCGESTHDEHGWPIGEVLVYQIVNHRFQLARELVLGAPLLHMHRSCVENFRDSYVEVLDDRKP